MSKILVIAEHLNGELNAGLSKVMTCATAIGGEVDVAVLADSAADIAAAAATVEGVSRVLTVERADNAAPLAAVLAPQIAKLAEGYSHVLIAGTTFGKDGLPRAAALLGVQQVSDIMAVHSATSFDRPIYAGNAIVTVDVPAEPLICATVRLASFKAAGEQAAAPIEAASVDAEPPLMQGKLVMDTSRHLCTWDGDAVNLTVTEFLIVNSLAARPGHVKSRDQLMTAAYGEHIYVDDRTIDSHIKRLRKKMRSVDDDFSAIETLYGIGYRYNEE